MAVELMITNFEIHSFSDANYPDIRFEVYEFSELLEALMLSTNADINKDWKKKNVDWHKNERLYTIMKRGTALCVEMLIWYSHSICGGKLKAI